MYLGQLTNLLHRIHPHLPTFRHNC
uniref:Uncharacterized protein n=1 Tax=Arundo donax TaxID=35708 RepID=A0A0A9PVF4_ARUDO